MKVTVAILNDNVKSIKKTIVKTVEIIFIVFLLIALSFFIKNIYISPRLLNLATNLRQADKTAITTASVVKSAYPIFNEKNYIFSKDGNNKNNKKQKANDDKEDKDKSSTEIQILDSMVNDDARSSVQAMSKSQNKNINVTETSNYQKITIYDNVNILNYSDKKDIDISNISDKIITLTKTSDSILLYNTHTSESYSNSENYKFEYDGTYRSRNANFNMLKITDELQKNLADKNFKVKHDTTPHDYGTYNSSYSRSRVTVKNDLSQMGNVGLSIDVHRDAAGDLTYGPTVDIKGVKIAQCMIVLGFGTDTMKNPYWQDNLSLAIQLERIGNNYYPGLFKSILARNSVYNQDLNKFSILIEIGATGNTIDQAILSARCISNILNILYKN